MDFTNFEALEVAMNFARQVGCCLQVGYCLAALLHSQPTRTFTNREVLEIVVQCLAELCHDFRDPTVIPTSLTCPNQATGLE